MKKNVFLTKVLTATLLISAGLSSGVQSSTSSTSEMMNDISETLNEARDLHINSTEEFLTLETREIDTENIFSELSIQNDNGTNSINANNNKYYKTDEPQD